MAIPFDEVVSKLGPGQRVSLEPGSAIYRGPYDSSVLDVSADGVAVDVPMDKGKLVLLPVGTRVTMHVEGSDDADLEMEIVKRTGGRNRALLLSPYTPKQLVEATHKPRIPVIAVSSGKGGVGKTTFIVNFGIALSRLGKEVCIIDGDLGTANVDIVLNLSTPYNLAHVVNGQRHMVEILAQGPEGLIILPGGSGFQDLTTLSDEKFDLLARQFHELEAYADIILIDTGSGLSPAVTNFLVAAGETILVTTPEPHAITDCYALVKVLATQGYRGQLRLVVNKAEDEEEANAIARKMIFASKRFLHMELTSLGYISEDPAVSRSIKKQTAVLVVDPRAKASMQITSLAERLLGLDEKSTKRMNARGFLERMRKFVPTRKAPKGK